MSYLHLPRLHFAGRFQAAPSTVNNDPLHFDNATFKPESQEMQSKSALNGWWNPSGDAAWRLIGCRVTAAWMSHDQQADESDPIGRCFIADSDRSPPAKIVDLDPEQQLVSEVWGMQVRISLADGTSLLRARYETAAFADIWDRAAGGGGDIGAGAMYQSVLTDLEWGDISSSIFLKTLRQASQDGLLSIKFNVDGYNMDFNSPEFTRGRVVGSIGPSSKDEPRHFVVGRHFMAAAAAGANFFAPAGQVNFCAAIVDEQAGKIAVDLGNAVQTKTPGRAISDMGTLALGYLAPATTASGGQPAVLLDTFNYLAGGWYETTAGVVTLPSDRALTQDELAAIKQSPLVLTTTSADGITKVAVAEATNGTYIRADRFVFRLNPGDTASVRLFASQFGLPYADARIISIFDPSQLQAQASSPLGPAPQVGLPTTAVEFPASLITDQDGHAELVIRAEDPGAKRGFIDGQVYGVRTVLEENFYYGAGYNFNPWEFVSLLVWSDFTEENPPTWHGSIEPIFHQYANLYPVMKRIVDLKDYDSVCANVHILRLAFGLPVEDPNSMPVTRDLSGAKRKAILRWLDTPGTDGKPLKGTPSTTSLPAPVADQEQASVLSEPDVPLRGGKAIAASRRLMLRNKFQ